MLKNHKNIYKRCKIFIILILTSFEINIWCIGPIIIIFLLSARLNYGSESVGTVEISGIKGWSQVCDEGWDETDATVLCRELGYMYGFAITNAELSNGDVATFTDAFWKFNCTGNETTLANCTKGDHWQGHCTNGHLAAAVCHNKHKDKVNKSKCIQLKPMFQSPVRGFTCTSSKVHVHFWKLEIETMVIELNVIKFFWSGLQVSEILVHHRSLPMCMQ